MGHRGRLGSRVPHSRAPESLTAELAALKAKRDRGEISEEEFRVRRDATLSAFQQSMPGNRPDWDLP